MKERFKISNSAKFQDDKLLKTWEIKALEKSENMAANSPDIIF